MEDDHDVLHREIAGEISERLGSIARSFEAVLALGSGHGGFSAGTGRCGEFLVMTDLSGTMLRRAPVPVVADEEFLPFADESFDLVVSCLTLHWVNDLPGTLIQIRRILRPDGLFLGAMLGGNTLVELRNILLEAEIETTGGAGPRTSPVADIADGGALLQRAGFALPVVDSDTYTLTYPDLFTLMHELRGMGETNAVAARSRKFLRRDTLMLAAERYRARHGGADGRIPATFQVIWLTGWAPHGSQQKALRPGSAAMRLAEVLGAEERSAGEKSAPER